MTDDIRKKLDDIVGLIDEERVDEAESACRDELQARPDDVNLVGMLGAILMKKGDLDAAEGYLRRAIEIEPGFARPHQDLGALHLSRDEAGAAIPHFRKAMAFNPRDPAVIRGLVAALARAGREEEADEVRLEFMQELPTDHLLIEAEALCRKGESIEAEQICDVVLRREPESVGALRVLAMAATADKRYVIAEAYLKRIARLAPQDAVAQIDLGKFLHERGRYLEAIEQLKTAAHLSPDNPEIQLLLGNLLGTVGQTEAALQAYERCLQHNPDEPAALTGCGHMLRILGRQDEAQSCYKRCVEVCPEFGTAWWHLASLHRFSASDDEVATMRTELDSDELSPESAVGFHFALGRACEKRNDFEAAWKHYSLGNSGKRALIKFDPVRAELEQTWIKETFTTEFLSSKSAQTATETTPVFVLGMPRSGSTLVEQILASHSQIEGTGELPYIITMVNSMVAEKAGSLHYTELVGKQDNDALTRLGSSYLSSAKAHCKEGTPFFTDKMPANFPHVGFIRLILPHAKIIDARRDPMATCVANYRQLFAQGKNQTYDLLELAESYLQYVRMMEHWDAVLPGAVLRVQYEDVVADLDTQVRRMLEFCGLPFEEACVNYHKSSRPVNTASSEQVREPIYDSAVEFWKHYESHLGELREVLAPIL
jgi:tetratricopeptide (TPR) repeat protein